MKLGVTTVLKHVHKTFADLIFNCLHYVCINVCVDALHPS